MLEALLQAYPWFDHPEGMKFVEITRNPQRSVGHWLFQSGSISAFHRVMNTEEIWAVHAGRLHLHVLDPMDGAARTLRLGLDVGSGEVAIATVPAGHWQAAELAGETFAFGTNVCAPGFSYDAFEIARADELCRRFPGQAALIRRLARE